MVSVYKPADYDFVWGEKLGLVVRSESQHSTIYVIHIMLLLLMLSSDGFYKLLYTIGFVVRFKCYRHLGFKLSEQ